MTKRMKIVGPLWHEICQRGPRISPYPGLMLPPIAVGQEDSATRAGSATQVWGVREIRLFVHAAMEVRERTDRRIKS